MSIQAQVAVFPAGAFDPISQRAKIWGQVPFLDLRVYLDLPDELDFYTDPGSTDLEEKIVRFARKSFHDFVNQIYLPVGEFPGGKHEIEQMELHIKSSMRNISKWKDEPEKTDLNQIHALIFNDPEAFVRVYEREEEKRRKGLFDFHCREPVFRWTELNKLSGGKRAMVEAEANNHIRWTELNKLSGGKRTMVEAEANNHKRHKAQ